MSDLRTGTLTLLFTDIEGSTRLLHDLGERYRAVLLRHQVLLRTAFAEHDGEEVGTQGDSFFIVFHRAKDAVSAAIAAQQALISEAWPDGKAVRVRMGLHTGEPVKDGEDYVGMDVHRAARVSSAGHGGQILLSETTRNLVQDELPQGVSLKDLGDHRLKDLPRLHRLFQVEAAGLVREFPRLTSEALQRTNLPAQLPDLPGQQTEVEAVKHLLSKNRLVSLTGASTSACTPLALQVARGLLDRYPDGMWWVDMASLSDPAGLAELVVSVIGVRQQPGETVTEALITFFEPKPMLLLWDGYGRWPEAYLALASTLLSHCSKLRILATGENALGSADEVNYAVQSVDSLGGGLFVGRSQELAQLRSALEDVLSGKGRLVMLAGEPGIGKTRMALEVASHAGLRRAQVLWGRCHESASTPPYWPWAEAIESYVSERDARELKSEMGSGAADIAEIVPEVKDKLPELKPPPVLEPEQARFRLFDSVTRFFRRAASLRPIVIALDDLHWADKPSLLLLEFLVRELDKMPLLVICTYRDMEITRRHPLFDALGSLSRSRVFTRVLLRGLSEADALQFIELDAHIHPPQAMVKAVYLQTEGNPLFLTEVIRLLEQEGAFVPGEMEERQDWAVSIPQGVREVIGRRLNRLSEECNKVLRLASVVGRQFSSHLLERLSDAASPDSLLESLEEAMAVRLVEEVPRKLDHYQFTHALVRETLAAELSTTRRVRLHVRIGEALEAMYGAAAETHAAELAHHFSEAAALIGPEKLVRYSMVAAERALAAHAYEEAYAYFQRALAAKEGQPMDEETATLLFGLGLAQGAMGLRDEALVSLDRAFDYRVSSGDVASAVRIAQCPVPHLPGQVKSERQLFSRALTLVPADSLAASRLLVLQGTAFGIDEGDLTSANRVFAEALLIAKKHQDPALELLVTAAAGRVNGYHLHLQECLSQSRRAIELARKLDDPLTEANSHYFAALALWSTGNGHGAGEHAAAGLAPAERARDRLALANIFWASDTLGRLTGDFQAARAFSDRGLALLPRDPRLLGTRTLLEYEIGDHVQGATFYRRMCDSMRYATGASFEFAFVTSVTGFAAHYTGQFGRFDFKLAKQVAKDVLSSPTVTPLVEIRTQGGLGLIAVCEQDAAEAARRYAYFEARQGTMTPGGMGSVDHLLAIMAATMGRQDDAVRHFQDALGFCRQADYRPEYAHVAHDYAAFLLKRGEAENAVNANALRKEALNIAGQHGMRSLIGRINAGPQV